ncbi:MAG: hypothetical protein VKN33_00990 [Candidatus Sericytochromatia bacterium]|nr:hypothetical protein [Candidatus Sericytochromatia bacterium]
MLTGIVLRKFALCFFAALLWGWGFKPTAQAKELQAAISFGKPYYDAGQQVLRIPLEGPLPSYAQGIAKQPYRVYFDFQADARQPTLVAERVMGHPLLRAWAMAQHRPGTTRVSLTVEEDSLVLVAFDKALHHIVLAPMKRKALTGLPTPSPSLPPAAPRATPSPPLIEASPPPVPEEPPVASAAADSDIQEVLDRLAVLNRPLSLSAEQGLNYVPGLPPADESATPAPQPLPPAPTQAFPETPQLQSLEAPPAAQNYALQMSSAVMMGEYAASLPDFDGEARSEMSQLFGARFHGRWFPGGQDDSVENLSAWWAHQMDVYAGNMTFSDPQIAHGLHARQGWRLHLGGLRSVRLGVVEFQAGAGVAMKQERSWRAVAPVQGEAISDGTRFWWAPEALLMSHIPLLGGVHIYGEAAYSPTVTVLDSGAVTEPKPTSGQRLEGGLAWHVSKLRVALGYRRWSMASMGYTEASQGPVLTIGGWLTGR